MMLGFKLQLISRTKE